MLEEKELANMKILPINTQYYNSKHNNSPASFGMKLTPRTKLRLNKDSEYLNWFADDALAELQNLCACKDDYIIDVEPLIKFVERVERFHRKMYLKKIFNLTVKKAGDITNLPIIYKEEIP